MSTIAQPEYKGYVTTFAAVNGKGMIALEAALGFNSGALAQGCVVLELVGMVGLNEFEWKDRTAYSDGWHLDRSINEYVPRDAELRAHFGRLTNWSDSASDLLIKRFMEEQQRRLNIRSGPERIVKIRPSSSQPQSFPDSPRRDVPQWKLVVPKPFKQVAMLGPHDVVR